MISRIRSPFDIFFLNPVYVAARSLRSLRSNHAYKRFSNFRKAGNGILEGKIGNFFPGRDDPEAP